jgi:type I restriction enzyme S subunit
MSNVAPRCRPKNKDAYSSSIDYIPSGWSITSLHNVIDTMVSGWSPQCEPNQASSGEWAVLKTTAVKWSGFNYLENKKLPNNLDPRPALQVNAKDILITRAGPVERVGVIAYVENTAKRIMLSDKLIRLTTNKTCNARFLSIWLSSEFIQNYFSVRITGLAQSQTNISQEILKSVPCILPPLPEQQKIAATLSSVDEVIEKTQAQINKLKDLKTGMMQELLSPREGQAANINITQGESENGLHHTEFKDSPLGRIPVGWEIVTLDDLIKSMDGGVSVNGDNRQKNTDEIGVLKVSSVFKGRFLPNNHKAVIKEDEARVKLNPLKDRILFSRANTPELVGESGYIDKDYKDLFLPDKIWMIDVKDRAETNVKWLSYVLCAGQVRKTIADVATGTSGSMKNISKPNLLGIRIALPSFSEQVRIAAAVQSVDDNLYLTADKLEHTRSIKKALMQDLLTGKVRVKVNAA